MSFNYKSILEPEFQLYRLLQCPVYSKLSQVHTDGDGENYRYDCINLTNFIGYVNFIVNCKEWLTCNYIAYRGQKNV